MPVYRVLFGFEGKGQGWSETHQLKSAVFVNARDAANLMRSVAQKRANFLGAPFQVNAIRVSAYLTDAGNRAPANHFFQRINFTSATPSQTQDAEPGNVALIHRGLTAATGNQNQTFLGAPPDLAVNFGGNVIFGNANLGSAMDAYEAALIGDGTYAFGWGVSGTPTDYELTTIDQAPDAKVAFGLSPNFVLPAGGGPFYPARVRGVNNGKSPLNRAVLVAPSGLASVFTKEQIAFALAQAGGHMKIYPSLRQFVPYSAFIRDLTAGKHKRGRPFGSYRGRAPVEVRA